MHLLPLTIVLAAALAGIPQGCAAGDDAKRERTGARASSASIELLGLPGCPNTPALRRNLRAALASVGDGLIYVDVNLEDLPANDPRRGYPAPTILVNGRDLFGMPAPSAPVMGCRVYPDGLPGAAEIAAKLRASAPL